jgi:hypothetical protein
MTEQLSFFPKPPLNPTMPAPYSKAWLLLRDLLQGPVTQIDWLNMGRGWRLAAAFKELLYLGFPGEAEWVHADGWERPIKRYSMKPEGLEVALSRMKGGAL